MIDLFNMFIQNVEIFFLNENINMISSNHNLIVDNEIHDINKNEI